MVEALIKIAGSLFIGGIGLVLIVVSALVGVILAKHAIEHCKYKRL